MDWHFPKSDLAGEVNIASYARTIIEGERTISGLEIFVREVLQNSLDAAVRTDGTAQKVTVQMRIRTLAVGTRNAFNRALNWDRLKQHVAAAQRVSERRMDRYQFPDPAKLDGRAMQVLEIFEKNTIGLVGPDRIQREEEEMPSFGRIPKAYRALCRDDARREKISLGSGGTFGLGKAVLWRASAIQTVLFFSRLSVSADGAVFRAAAQARLCNHYLTTQQYRGLGFGGKMHGDFCAPLTNTDATDFARALDTQLRDDLSDVGTTIIIPFWEAPPPKSDDKDVEITALLARYAARYFWPAIIDGRLDVSITNGTRTSDARDHLTKYNSFIELYRRVRADSQDARDAAPEKINFAVPVGPPPLRDPEAHTFIRCGLTFVDPENPEQRVSDDLLEKVAEIRGQGMVIGYQRLTGRARVKPFVGIALGGRIADDRDSGIRGDMLLGYSEHVTHTRWDQEADALGNWPDARPRVRILLDKVAGYFQRNAGIAPPRTSDDLTAVEEGLHFPGVKEGGTTPPVPPPPGIPQLSKRLFQQRNGRYVFDVRARVEPDKPPVRLDVWIEAGIETGRPSKEDRLRMERIETTPPGLSVDQLGNGKVRIALPTFGSGMQVRVTGETELLSAELLAVTEAELRAKVERMDMPEAPDPTPSGEQPDVES